jgi:hypothetical protein
MAGDLSGKGRGTGTLFGGEINQRLASGAVRASGGLFAKRFGELVDVL